MCILKKEELNISLVEQQIFLTIKGEYFKRIHHSSSHVPEWYHGDGRRSAYVKITSSVLSSFLEDSYKTWNETYNQ